MPVPSRPIPELAREIQPNDLEALFAAAHFPADRKQLVAYARARFASADLLAVLDSLPNRVYHSNDDVSAAVRQLAMT